MRGGRAERAELPRGPGGRVLCRWCSLEVPAGRRTFCSDWCVHEWRLRTDPGYLRDQVFERDKGVCAACRLDTVAEWRRIESAFAAAAGKAEHGNEHAEGCNPDEPQVGQGTQVGNS